MHLHIFIVPFKTFCAKKFFVSDNSKKLLLLFIAIFVCEFVNFETMTNKIAMRMYCKNVKT